MEVLYLWEAVRQAEEYGNNEPLIKYIESGNPIVLQDQYTRDLLVKFIRGESFLGQGQKFKSKRVEDERERIIQIIYILKGYGLPLSSKKKDGTPDALTIVGGIFHKDPEHIRKYIWGKQKKRGTWELFIGIGEMYKKEGYKIEDFLPTELRIGCR